jgi:hypothetical protein
VRLYSAIGADQVGMAMNRPEEQLHRACADLLRLYEARGLLAFCHVPNGFGRTPAEAGIAKALGQRAGVPDLLVWLPGGRSFGLELKAGKRPLSPAQQTWHATMATLGHRVAVCRSIEDMQAALGAEGVPAIRTINACQKACCGLPDEWMKAGKKAMRVPHPGDTGA